MALVGLAALSFGSASAGLAGPLDQLSDEEDGTPTLATATATPQATATGSPPRTGTPAAPATAGPSPSPAQTARAPEPISLTVASRRPVVTLDVTRIDSAAGPRFEIRLTAESDFQLSKIWWWANGTSDPGLKAGRSLTCDGQARCEGSWQVTGSYATAGRLLAVARDARGLESDLASAALPPADGVPAVELNARVDPTDPERTFLVAVEGRDNQGLSQISWWVPGSKDRELVRPHAFNCDGRGACQRTWQVSTGPNQTLTLAAQAEGSEGNGSAIGYGTIRLKRFGPTFTLLVDRVAALMGEQLKVEMEAAEEVDGVWSIGLQALERETGAVLNAWDLSCEGDFRCRRSLTLKADRAGTYLLRARATDRYGRESAESSAELLVRGQG